MTRHARLLFVVFTFVLAAGTSYGAVAATISGMVYTDVNGNGALNPGEAGIAGVTVTLDFNADGSVDATTTTGAGGTYSFGGLLTGTYRVRQVVPAGAMQTTGNPADLIVIAGDNITGIDFGDYSFAINGRVFNDTNGNGALNPGETGLAGVTLQADLGANGSVDATTTTDGSGNYSFTGLAPGIYRIRQVVPAGAVQTSPNPPDIGAAGSGTVVSGVDFGDFFFSISGTAFNDSNGNGALNPGEIGLAGVTIQLDFGLNGTVDATATTDGSGNYSFTGLGPGNYRIREVVPPGRTQTSADPADITAVSGTTVTGVNFGSLLSSAIPALSTWMLALLAMTLGVLALKR